MINSTQQQTNMLSHTIQQKENVSNNAPFRVPGNLHNFNDKASSAPHKVMNNIMNNGAVSMMKSSDRSYQDQQQHYHQNSELPKPFQMGEMKKNFSIDRSNIDSCGQPDPPKQSLSDIQNANMQYRPPYISQNIDFYDNGLPNFSLPNLQLIQQNTPPNYSLNPQVLAMNQIAMLQQQNTYPLQFSQGTNLKTEKAPSFLDIPNTDQKIGYLSPQFKQQPDENKLIANLKEDATSKSVGKKVVATEIPKAAPHKKVSPVPVKIDTQESERSKRSESLSSPKQKNTQQQRPRRSTRTIEKQQSEKAQESTQASQKKTLGKRGRKRENQEIYKDRANKKIAELRAKLLTAKDDNVDVKTRQKWRNQVSAQESRLKKKEEVIYLYKLVNDGDQKLEHFLDILNNNFKSLNKSDQEKVIGKMNSAIKEQFQGESQQPKKGYKRQKVDHIAEFGLLFKNNFITNKSELEKYQPNEEKTSKDYENEDSDSDMIE